MRAVVIAGLCLLVQSESTVAQAPLASHAPRRSSTKMFVPTSALVDLTRQIARREGYSLTDPREHFVDLMENKDGSPAWQGYATAGFYWHGDLVLQVAIHQRTGQVVDPAACREYDYPEVRAVRREYARVLDATLLPRDVLARAFGCDSLTLRPARPPSSR